MRCVAVLGLGSRYSYLAATQLPALEAEFGITFDWWPVHSPDLIRRGHGGVSPFAAPERFGQYDLAYRDKDARRWAALYGVAYAPPPSGLPELRSMAETCWSFTDRSTRRRVAEAVFRAVFERGEIPDAAFLSRLRTDTGASDRDGTSAHAEAVEAALAAGAFGVPTFLIDDDLFWGNDRLVLVRDALSARM
ncbi:MAG: DsbA family protein [Albidovulum sp.]